MNTEMKNTLQAAIAACASKAEKTNVAIDALQYTQAALNAANALITLTLNPTKD